MTGYQKVFLIYVLTYLLCKFCLGMIFYLITGKIKERALKQEKQRDVAKRERNYKKNLKLAGGVAR